VAEANGQAESALSCPKTISSAAVGTSAAER